MYKPICHVLEKGSNQFIFDACFAYLIALLYSKRQTSESFCNSLMLAYPSLLYHKLASSPLATRFFLYIIIIQIIEIRGINITISISYKHLELVL